MSSSSARRSSKFRDGELGEPRLVRGTRPTLDDGPCLVGACGGEEEGDVPRNVQETHRQRDRVAAGVRESPSVPAREDVLERCLDARAEVEPPGEPLRHLAHRRERVTGSRAGVGDGLLDHRGADLRSAAGPDVGPVERQDLGGVGRVDEEERGSVRDVVAEQLRRLVAVRGAPGGVEERHVVRVRELLRRCSGELAETDREHGGAQRVLERLPGAEVGREREGTDHLGSADRPLARRHHCCDCSGILRRHVGILRLVAQTGASRWKSAIASERVARGTQCIVPPAELSNTEIADRLSLFAALLELAETNPFAVRAYVRAAELIRSTPASVSELVHTGRIRELRGIGPGIEAKLRELVETGDIAELHALEVEMEPELVGYGRSLGLSAKRMLGIARALDVDSVAAFKDAVAAGRLTEAVGVGAVTEAKIRAALENEPKAPRGLTLNRSRPLAHALADALGGEVAGPARRFCELVYELAVVCAADDPVPVITRFERLPAIVAVLERSERRAVGLTMEGVPVTLVVATPHAFGTELLRATGSSEYVEAVEPLPDAPDEASLFAQLGQPYCPPELREKPFATPPPGLVERPDIKGDLHCHTTWSDGKATVHAMALAAQARGYEYLAICDHTPNVRVVPGLSSDDLARQGEEIAVVNELLTPFRVLRGVECDIRADGSLDVEDHVLAELDWVQLSLHAGQRRPASELTRIVTEAMRHPAVRALSHRRAESSTTGRRMPSTSTRSSPSRRRPAWRWR